MVLFMDSMTRNKLFLKYKSRFAFISRFQRDTTSLFNKEKYGQKRAEARESNHQYFFQELPRIPDKVSIVSVMLEIDIYRVKRNE